MPVASTEISVIGGQRACYPEAVRSVPKPSRRLAPLLRDTVGLLHVAQVAVDVLGPHTNVLLAAPRGGPIRAFRREAVQGDGAIAVVAAAWPPHVPSLEGSAEAQVIDVEGERFVVVGAGRSGALCLSGALAAISTEQLVDCANLIAAAVRHADVVERLASSARSAHRDNRQLRARLQPGRVIAHSQRMLELLARVERAAPYDATVLLEGESGVGKEVIARHLHEQSLRARGPFVALNCAAVPDTLVESTLFGHERGAFTGAHVRRLGVFEQAAGGTLLLDEVGEMSAAAQASLLRVLETRTLQRVGGERDVSVDVRVVAATNRTLLTQVACGAFREDLYYRLATITLVVPPLRLRPADVVPLAEHLLARAASRVDQRPPLLDETAQRALLAYHWPGNVRELSNVLERAMVFGETLLTGRDIDDALPTDRRASDNGPGASFKTLHEATREHLLAALRRSGGRIYGRDGAAALLGLKPSTLQSKLAKHGVDRI